MSRQSARLLISHIKGNGTKSLCLASGSSPLGLYKNFVDAYKEDPANFPNLKVVKLDEWGGIDITEETSGESYLKTNILAPLRIKEPNFISFQTNTASPEKECERVQDELENLGALDVCILGLGMNGHLGFNEPAKELMSYCHVAKLSRKTLQHAMAVSMAKKPTYGLTLGMANILNSKKIILVVSGAHKQIVIKHLLEQKISTYLPASLLWLHPNTTCFIDEESHTR
ncbi:6-phosphogluconolactonase [Gramella sp. AN32]|uniref:6-phosphogluconolactonase n=1 Tax=Christiangramia antarctica TaxID=2058158 RepID=A0ABW5X419_9FLAO|nr:6-phosphogluconolactonase [Gramella sp. AN32]